MTGISNARELEVAHSTGLRHKVGRAIRFAATVMTCLLVSSVLFDHIALNDQKISVLAAPALLVSIFSIFGMFSSHNDRSFATGLVVGIPFSFFILQVKLSGLIDSPDLRSGATRILIIASILAVLIWIVEALLFWWTKRKQAKNQL